MYNVQTTRQNVVQGRGRRKQINKQTKKPTTQKQKNSDKQQVHKKMAAINQSVRNYYI